MDILCAPVMDQYIVGSKSYSVSIYNVFMCVGLWRDCAVNAPYIICMCSAALRRNARILSAYSHIHTQAQIDTSQLNAKRLESELSTAERQLESLRTKLENVG